MANVVLDYAVSFNQVQSLPAPSFGFLHKIGVVVPNETVDPTAVITTPAGTAGNPAIITLTGEFLTGTVLDGEFTSDVQVPPFGAPLLITDAVSAEEAAILWADLIKGIDQLTAVAVGATIEIEPVLPGVNVGVANVAVDLANVSPFVEVTNKADLLAISPSHAFEIDGVFDGGLNRVTLILVDDITELGALITDKETDFYTIHNSSAFVTADFLTEVISWGGVIGFSDISKSTCEDNALNANTCAFYYDFATPNAYKALFAFGSLLAATFWRNQQYITVSDISGAITDTGEAESLFDSRVSFWITDNESGTRLGFFVAGGKSITTPYISKQLELSMQFNMTNFLTVNQPYNVDLERSELARIGNKQISEYLDLGYLDPDGQNTLTVTKSEEVFVVNGNLTTSPAVALWRVKIDSFQTQG